MMRWRATPKTRGASDGSEKPLHGQRHQQWRSACAHAAKAFRKNLLPTLKASNFDYIIFDMPPVARTGVTQRLAGFMDMMMLLVVEAEKTSRDVVRQAGNLLTESKANVSVVLNKTRTYIPARFHEEF